MKKLIVWDGDETLWSGTLIHGETASLTPERIEFVRDLRDRGVLQSIASHNTLADVMGVITKYELEDCFLVPQAHLIESDDNGLTKGVPKSFMIKTIMEELGIVKAEDVVYVDDQLFNLDEAAKAFPGMTCCLPRWVLQVCERYFTKDSYNDDDRSRVRRYRSEQDRKRASVDYQGNYLDFLRTCDMKAEVRMPTEEEMDRVIDLIRRANQLAIIPIDLPDEEIRELRNSIRGCWSTDKFGDNGLVGALLCYHHVISLFVVSCRMQGKGIGSYLLGSVLNENVGHTVLALWKQTEYNKSMLELLKYFKFEESGKIEPEIQSYYFLSDTELALPDWIKPL